MFCCGAQSKAACSHVDNFLLIDWLINSIFFFYWRRMFIEYWSIPCLAQCSELDRCLQHLGPHRALGVGGHVGTALVACWCWNSNSLQWLRPWDSFLVISGLNPLTWFFVLFCFEGDSMPCWHLALIWIYISILTPRPPVHHICFNIFDSQGYGFGTHFVFTGRHLLFRTHL